MKYYIYLNRAKNCLPIVKKVRIHYAYKDIQVNKYISVVFVELPSDYNLNKLQKAIAGRNKWRYVYPMENKTEDEIIEQVKREIEIVGYYRLERF